MNLFRPALVLPVFVSLGLHAAMGWSVARHWSSSPTRDSEPIQISYAEPRKPAARLQEEGARSAPSVPKKKRRGIPVPHLPVKEEVVSTPEPTDFQKNVEANLKKQQRLLAKLDAPKRAQSAPGTGRPKSSAEILADPKKGKIFVGYFTEVRRKIQETLSGRYARRYSARGGVALGFVLNTQGFIEKVAVLEKGTDGDGRLQELAVQCLRESAPFGAFPPELGSDRIAFNVTLYFVDR